MVLNRVVYSAGGAFRLSTRALKRFKELAGKDFCIHTTPRHSKELIEAVEELGSLNASGPGANLQIYILHGNKYIINMDKNSESVVEEIDWITV